MKKIAIISLGIVLFMLTSCNENINAQINSQTEKKKKTIIIYSDTVCINSDIELLKSGMDYQIVIKESQKEKDNQLIWELNLSSNHYSLKERNQLYKDTFKSFSIKYDHLMTITVNDGKFLMQNNILSHPFESEELIIKDYSWVSTDTSQMISFLLDSIIVEPKTLVFGRDFFTTYRISYISDRRYSFLQGTYISIDEKKHKTPSNAKLILTDVILKNDYTNDFDFPGHHRYYGFIVH